MWAASVVLCCSILLHGRNPEFVFRIRSQRVPCKLWKQLASSHSNSDKLKGEKPASPPQKLQFRAPTWRPVKLQELTNGSGWAIEKKTRARFGVGEEGGGMLEQGTELSCPFVLARVQHGYVTAGSYKSPLLMLWNASFFLSRRGLVSAISPHGHGTPLSFKDTCEGNLSGRGDVSVNAWRRLYRLWWHGWRWTWGWAQLPPPSDSLMYSAQPWHWLCIMTWRWR